MPAPTMLKAATAVRTSDASGPGSTVRTTALLLPVGVIGAAGPSGASGLGWVPPPAAGRGGICAGDVGAIQRVAIPTPASAATSAIVSLMLSMPLDPVRDCQGSGDDQLHPRCAERCPKGRLGVVNALRTRVAIGTEAE